MKSAIAQKWLTCPRAQFYNWKQDKFKLTMAGYSKCLPTSFTFYLQTAYVILRSLQKGTLAITTYKMLIPSNKILYCCITSYLSCSKSNFRNNGDFLNLFQCRNLRPNLGRNLILAAPTNDNCHWLRKKEYQMHRLACAVSCH